MYIAASDLAQGLPSRGLIIRCDHCDQDVSLLLGVISSRPVQRLLDKCS